MTDGWLGFSAGAESDAITAFADRDYSPGVHGDQKMRYVQVPANSATTRARDIGKQDGMVVGITSLEDIAVFAGRLPPELEVRDQEKPKLLALIDQFADEGFSCVGERASKVSRDSAEAAKALFALLLPGRQLPKIAPDGEGGLIAVWESPEDSVVLVVDNWRLHLVARATTPRATYFDDVPFDGERLPDVVIEWIPR